MISSQHYSALHWQKQRRDIDRYIDQLNAKDDKISGRTGWAWWRDPANNGEQDSVFERMKKLDRIKELRTSAGDLLKRAHVNTYKMFGDPLRFNDTSFSVMLDDAKKELHERIDVRRKEERHKDNIETRVTQVYYAVRDNQYDRSRRPKKKIYPGQILDIDNFSDAISDLATAMGHVQKQFQAYVQWSKPRPSHGLGTDDHSGDAVKYAIVGEKGQEVVLSPGGRSVLTIDETKWKLRQKEILSKGGPIYYGADLAVWDHLPKWATVILRSNCIAREYFCTTHDQWKERRSEPLPRVNESVQINGVRWTRIR